MTRHRAGGRSSWTVRTVAGILGTALILLGCGNPGNGGDLYASACATCHGPDRSGIERLGPDLGPDSFALEESDDWIADRIRSGYQRMPGFERILAEDQIGVLVAYLRADAGVSDPVAVTTSTAAPATTTGTTTTGPPDPTGPVTTIGSTSTSAASTTTGPPDEDDVLAHGRRIYETKAGGVGCASCHGADGTGTSDGPNIIGVSKSAISGALGGGVIDMADIELSPEELDAVYQYVRLLTEQRQS